MDITTPDVVANCEDLKVLGKGDFKALIKWRTSLREEVRCFHDFIVLPTNSRLCLAWSRSENKTYGYGGTHGDRRNRRGGRRGG